MKRNITLIALAAALIAAPAITQAQDATASNMPDAIAVAPKHHGLTFRGKVTAVSDATANPQTVTVGGQVYNVTSDTKITKNGATAAFSDLTVGEAIHGAYIKDGEQMTAKTIVIGKGKKKSQDQ